MLPILSRRIGVREGIHEDTMTRILIRAVVATGFLPLTAAQAADELQAGVACVDITPPTGFAMWGYAARKDIMSKLRELAADNATYPPLRKKAMVLIK